MAGRASPLFGKPLCDLSLIGRLACALIDAPHEVSFFSGSEFAFCPELLDLIVRQVLDSYEQILDLTDPDQLVELDLDCRVIAVLRVLKIRNTIRNVTMVVPVLITNCHVSE